MTLISRLSMSFAALLFATEALALGRLFHGEAAAPPKAAAPKVLAAVTRASGVAEDTIVENFLREFAAALKARDAAGVLPRLAGNYRIDGLPAGKKPADMFRQAVEQIPGPDEFIVRAVSADGGTRTARVDLRYGERLRGKTLTFDPAGKLAWSDLFTLQVKQAGE